MSNMDLIAKMFGLGDEEPQPRQLPNLGGTQNDLMYREATPQPLPQLGGDPVHGNLGAMAKYGQELPPLGAANPPPLPATPPPLDPNAVIDPMTGGMSYAPELAPAPAAAIPAAAPTAPLPPLGADPAAVDELGQIGEAASRGIPSTDMAQAPALPELGERSLEAELADVQDPTQFDKPIYRRVGTNETTNNEKKAQEWAEGYETVREGGRKRNKKWSTLEKIGAAAMGWAQGGLFGGIKAGTDRNYFQKLSNERKRGELLPQIAAQQGIAKKNEEVRNLQNQQITRTANTISQNQRRGDQTRIEDARLKSQLSEIARLPSKEALARLIDLHKSVKTFNAKTNPQHKAIFEKAKKLGEILPDKDETTPEKGGVDVDDNTLFTSLGIDDDETLKSRAASKVAVGANTKDFDPLIVNAIPRDLRNPDGSFNLEMFQAAKNKAVPDPRVAGITLDQLTRNAPDDYKQRHAAEVERLRGSQKDLRSEAATLRTALKTHRPNRPDAPVESSAAVIKFFKDIMAQPAGDKRKADLDKFYKEYLPNIRIQ